jgi:hypothetical protein
MADGAVPVSPTLPPGGESRWDELSPDGLTRVDWLVSDGRMSHIIVTPALSDAATGAPILTTLDNGFDGRIGWLGDGRFTLDLRHYWRDGSAALEIDRRAATFRFVEGGAPGASEPIAGIGRQIEARFPSAASVVIRTAAASPRWRTAAILLLAVAAAALFAGMGLRG